MRALERFGLRALLFTTSFGLFACSPPIKAPDGYAIVREHVIYSPGNVPPIHSNLDYTIVEIDGAPVTREPTPPLADMQPGALIPVGTHRFKAIVEPHMRPPNLQPKEVTFSASVANRKIYDLVDDKDGQPVLIELIYKER
jgi:hypothetical protein